MAVPLSHVIMVDSVSLMGVSIPVSAQQDTLERTAMLLITVPAILAKMAAHVEMEMMVLFAHALRVIWVPLVELQTIATAIHAKMVAAVRTTMTAFIACALLYGPVLLVKSRQAMIARKSTPLATVNLELATTISLISVQRSSFNATNTEPSVLKCRVRLELNGTTVGALAS
jgi:hypothetical protein